MQLEMIEPTDAIAPIEFKLDSAYIFSLVLGGSVISPDPEF
jgi:hypothetical protein